MRARILAVALLSAACTPQGVCEYHLVNYCADDDATCTGRLFDPYTWESNPIDSGWLPFPGQREWIMTLRDAKTSARIAGQVLQITAYVSSNNVGSDGTLAGGNLAEVRMVTSNVIGVRNDTCADYFVRVVVTSRPLPDGGTE